MIKASKTQVKTVIHDGKVYRGVMPNLNMKTDLKDSFEYISTIVEGMSSGNMNGNPVFDDFKKQVINNTIEGEVQKLMLEGAACPGHFSSSKGGRHSSIVSRADSAPTTSGMHNIKASEIAAEMFKKDFIEVDLTSREKTDFERAPKNIRNYLPRIDAKTLGEKIQEMIDRPTKKKKAKKTTKKTTKKKATKKKVAKKRNTK